MQTADERSIQKCSGDWKYCNGNCTECGANDIYATNSTGVAVYSCDADAFGKPSKEAYEKAKQDKEYTANALFLCRKRRDDLIDELSREREHEKLYMEMYEKHRDIIRKYEIYEELEANDYFAE